MDIQMSILLFLQSIRTNFLDKVFLAITISAETSIIVFVTALIYWCINKKYGQKIMFSLCTNIVLNAGIKKFVKSPRPIGIEGLESMRVETAGGYSFPSGHTQMATTFWYSIIKCFKNRLLCIVAIFMIIAVGISRLYLAVHWPIDVLFGWIFGILFTYLAFKIFDYVDKNKDYKPLIYMFLIFLVYIYLSKSHGLLRIFGVFSGFILGYIVEDKYIGFTTNLESIIRYNGKAKNIGKITKIDIVKLCVKRLVIGLFTLGILYILLKYISVFITANLNLDYFNWILDYLRYTMVVFYAIAGVPALFKVLKLD